MKTEYMTSKEKTDAIFNKALEQLNSMLKKAFWSNNKEPEKGLDRIKYLIKQIEVVDNVIKINKGTNFDVLY